RRTARPTAWPTGRWTRRPRSWSSPDRRRSGAAPAHERDHPPAALALAPVRVVRVRLAGRAVADVMDVLRRQARVQQLPLVGGAHVEMRPAARARPKTLRLSTERLAQLVPDLVAADAHGRAERAVQAGGPRPPGHEGLDGAAHNPGRRAPPAGVSGRDQALLRVYEQHRQAVGGLDAEQQPGRVAGRRIAFRPPVPRRVPD